MNQPQSVSTRCPHCNLTNFASAEYCKRCKNNLHNPGAPALNGDQPAGTGDGHTININISLPQANGTGPVQPNININGLTNREPARPVQPQHQQPQHQQPQYQPQTQMPPRPSYRQLPPRQPGEYQLQNQTGFEQWQQMNNPPLPAPAPAGYIPTGRGYMPPPTQRMFRKGTEMVVHELGDLPLYCVKCNEDASPYSGGSLVKQKYRWHHPAVYIAMISPLIFLILSLALSKRANLYLPLCKTHFESRKTAGGFLIGGGILATIMIFFLMGAGSVGLAFLVFFGALFGLVIGHEYSYKPLRAAKIDNDFVYLKGASPAYLNRLPYC